MPVTKEEALAYIGLTDEQLAGFEDAEAFKAAYDGEWLKRSEAFKDPALKAAAFGKTAGVLVTNAKKALQAIGEDVSEADLKAMKPEDLIDRVKTASDAFYGKQVKELQTSLEGAKGDKTTKDLEKQLAEAIKHRDEYKTLATDLDGKLKAKDEEFVKTTRSAKEKELWDAAMGKAPFKKDLDPLTRTGFETLVRSKVKIAWDEDGKPYTADASGNRIKDTSKSNAFLELDQVIAAEVLANKLNDANPHAGKPVGATSKPTATEKPVEPQPGQRIRQVHPAAQVA